MKRKLKNSVGIWAFGHTPTRFVGIGYHHELSNETMEARTERVLKGLGDIDGYEYHYPNEINENNVSSIKEILASEGKETYIA